MSKIQLDQGTILTRIRSEKYPGVNCYGILITASCDVAQKKVQKYYYLTGVKANEWLTTEPAFCAIYKSHISNLASQLAEAVEGVFDVESLKRRPVPEALNAIEQTVKDESKQEKIKKAYEAYSVFAHPNMTADDRKEAIRCRHEEIRSSKKSKKTEEESEAFLKKIARGELFHYYYLPMKAYRDPRSVDWIGMVVDFQEIGFLYQRDLERLRSPGFDPYTLDPGYRGDKGYTEAERARYRQIFFMDDTDEPQEGSSVEIAGCIRSPWREHLLQRFSFSFTRIGLEDIEDAHYRYLIQSVNG